MIILKPSDEEFESNLGQLYKMSYKRTDLNIMVVYDGRPFEADWARIHPSGSFAFSVKDNLGEHRVNLAKVASVTFWFDN